MLRGLLFTRTVYQACPLHGSGSDVVKSQHRRGGEKTVKSLELPALLRLCREVADLTQADLGVKLQRDRIWISTVENGHKSVTVDELIAWANATNGGEILGRAISQACGASDVGYQQVIQARSILAMVQSMAQQFSVVS